MASPALVDAVLGARAADQSVKTAPQVLEALQRDGGWQELTLAVVRRAVTAANAQQPKLTPEEKAQRRKHQEAERNRKRDRSDRSKRKASVATAPFLPRKRDDVAPMPASDGCPAPAPKRSAPGMPTLSPFERFEQGGAHAEELRHEFRSRQLFCDPAGHRARWLSNPGCRSWHHYGVPCAEAHRFPLHANAARYLDRMSGTVHIAGQGVMQGGLAMDEFINRIQQRNAHGVVIYPYEMWMDCSSGRLWGPGTVSCLWDEI